MGAPDDESLIRDVRAASAALAEIVPHAVGFEGNVADAMRATCDLVEPALGEDETVLAVVGDAAARRALMRGVLGESIVRGPTGKRERTTRVRTADAWDYTAREKGGKTVRFARVMPDRDGEFSAALEAAEREVDAARAARAVLEGDVQKQREAVRAIEVEILALDDEVDAAGNAFAEAWRAERAAKTTHAAIVRAAPNVPVLFARDAPWWALWIFLMRWMLRNKYREPLAAFSQNRAEAAAAEQRATDLGEEARGREEARDAVRAKRTAHDTLLERAQAELAHVEVMLSEERALKAAEERVEALLRDRARHARERKEELFSDLREIDATARGDTVEELDVECPADHPNALPRGLVLVFAATPPDDADGYVVVKDALKPAPKDDELRAKLPRVATLAMRAGPAALHAPLARFAGNKLVVGARLAMRLRACIADAARARADAEARHQRRLGALEAQRIPHPDAFRKKQLERSEPSILKSAGEVIDSSREKLRAGIESLAKDWTDRVARAQGKRAIEACVADVNQRGKMRVLELLESVSEHVAREMQSASESLERWALDEVQSSYKTSKKVRAESLAPVASEITGEDLAAEIAPHVPIPTALATFKKQRARIAIAGAVSLGAAGTGAGMLAGGAIPAAIGGGVGLVLGVASSLLKPTASLRAECLASIQRYAAEVTRASCGLVDQKRGDVEQGIRGALDSAVAETLERLNDAITRLMTVERNAIEAERSALARLASTDATLEEHDKRLAARLEEAEAIFKASS